MQRCNKTDGLNTVELLDPLGIHSGGDHTAMPDGKLACQGDRSELGERATSSGSYRLFYRRAIKIMSQAWYRHFLRVFGSRS